MRLLSLLLVLVVGCGVLTPAARADEKFTVRFVDLAGHDGIKLGANVVTPTSPGPHPLIVLPGSWGGGNTQNLLWSTELAKRGMIAVNYATRGAGDSGGTVDFAGPDDVRDVRSVINWALANTDADPARIGLAGISYAGPIMLNAAAADPRIKAVVMTSGLVDIEEMLIRQETRYGLLALGFRVTAAITARTAPDFNTMLDDFFANRNMDELRAWARERSPVTRLDALNRNGTAVYMAHAWNDSVARNGQIMRFYDRLTGPKRLELYPGDHVSPELTGVLTLPNEAFDTLYRWLEVHVAGVRNPADVATPIRLRPRTPDRSGPLETYRSTAEFEAPATRYGLGAPGTALAPGETSAWQSSITADSTTSDAGITMGTSTLEALTGRPPTVWLPGVDRRRALLWQSAPLARATKLRGTVDLHLTVVPNDAVGTVFGYLYAVDGAGTGELINHASFTWTGATPGRARTIDVRFDPMAFDVPAGRRLALVVDAKDLMYLDENTTGETLRFTGPASLDLPSRN
ncbi:CocE/NonD family hydrolase [Cryptosporangium aurantiacum]|uniref:Predicted acyl esterase n=1 Tax=Cryptosporangium aurantiacum TaxID=134849 RepID=A0A1M7R7V5_9ACTN|nr:CocE/NonD family hydrolase [Cryptosporangium aurantiacum]SHN42387.1 Predicted acyl esterase [Cryptosporangium aurantiacum]